MQMKSSLGNDITRSLYARAVAERAGVPVPFGGKGRRAVAAAAATGGRQLRLGSLWVEREIGGEK